MIDRKSATIVNALIRCTRSDQTAEPLFELVRPDLGLWVKELHHDPSEVWNVQIAAIISELDKHRDILISMRNESSDYTLHLTASADDSCDLRIPKALIALAHECGFEIEIYTEE